MNIRPLRIGTHDGVFHCDEALGCWMLKKTKRFRGAQVTRTREEALLKDMDALLDVGGVYDPERLRFDHHQRSFDEVFGHGHTIKLSSAGLVFKHFGDEILREIVKPIELDDQELNVLIKRVYRCFIEGIDGMDNGISASSVRGSIRYVDGTGLLGKISRLNPPWNNTDPEVTENSQFEKAMEVSGDAFAEYVIDAAKRWLPARRHVKDAFEERFSFSSDGAILVLPITCPWKDHLIDIENEHNAFGRIKYCIYQDVRDGYRVQAVPTAPESFKPRLPLPKEWRSLQGAELDRKCGIVDCIFVHRNGFIGGHKTQEGALSMAQEALRLSKKRGSI